MIFSSFTLVRRWILLCCALFLIMGCAKKHYQLEKLKYTTATLESGTLDVFYAPKTKIKTSKDRYRCNSSKKYQSVLFTNLKGPYDDVIAAINQGSYFSYATTSDRPFFNRYKRASFSAPWGEVIFYADSKTTSDQNSTRPVENLSVDSLKDIDTSQFNNLTISNILIELNFDLIFNCARDGGAEDPVILFNQMGIDVLQILSWAEVAFTWPQSISQDITEKTFERIPIANQSSLARYGSFINDYYSLVLLNPKFRLRVDNVGIRKSGLNGSVKKIFNLDGVTNFSFQRNGLGKIDQFPFLQFYENPPTQNSEIGKEMIESENNGDIEVKYYNIGSTGDFELSSVIRDSRYVALFQPFMRSNVKDHKPMDDDIGDVCCQGYECTSSIILENELVNYYQNIPICYDMPIYTKKLLFGERNLIVAEIAITINGKCRFFPIGTSTRELLQSGDILKDFIIQRVYKGSLKKTHIKDKAPIILLPGDQILF